MRRNSQSSQDSRFHHLASGYTGLCSHTWHVLCSLTPNSKPVNTPKENQPWIFIGRTDAEAETPILWPPDTKNWLIEKDPDAGKDWRREEKGTTEDEMVGWHHQLNGHDFEQAPGVGDGQGSLACCSPCGHKESDTTDQLNWTETHTHTHKKKSGHI